jgi:GT2 family glycosyltransferase
MAGADRPAGARDGQVAVILLHLNTERHTRQCLDSLGNVTHRPLEVILIDNGSSDGSGLRIRDDYPEIVFVRLEENLGFSGGNNVGMRLALERGAEYLCLLNNDTVVDPGFLDPLLAGALPAVGVQSCKIYYLGKPDTFWYAGGVLDVGRALSSHRGMAETDRGQYDEPGETAFATGCMMFMARAVVEKVGLLDDRFFAYFEDADWCLRARAAGYRVVYTPAAKIWHDVSTTTKIDSPVYLYLTMRNKILFLRAHSTPARIAAEMPYLLYFYGRQFIRLAFKYRDRRKVEALLYGISDGLAGRTGRHGEGRVAKVARP